MISLFLDNQNPNLFIYLFVVFGDPPPNFYFYFKKKIGFLRGHLITKKALVVCLFGEHLKQTYLVHVWFRFA